MNFVVMMIVFLVFIFQLVSKKTTLCIRSEIQAHKRFIPPPICPKKLDFLAFQKCGIIVSRGTETNPTVTRCYAPNRATIHLGHTGSLKIE